MKEYIPLVMRACFSVLETAIWWVNEDPAVIMAKALINCPNTEATSPTVNKSRLV